MRWCDVDGKPTLCLSILVVSVLVLISQTVDLKGLGDRMIADEEMRERHMEVFAAKAEPFLSPFRSPVAEPTSTPVMKPVVFTRVRVTPTPMPTPYQAYCYMTQQYFKYTPWE